MKSDRVYQTSSFSSSPFSSSNSSLCCSKGVVMFRKKVHFFPEVRVKMCLALSEYTAEELASQWYTMDDVMTMRNHDRRIAQMMNRGVMIPRNDPFFCTRGLESKTPNGAFQRIQNKRKGMLSVLLEQARQWKDSDYYDDDGISERYAFTSRRCAVEARWRGIMDEEDVAFFNWEDHLCNDRGEDCSLFSESIQSSSSSPTSVRDEETIFSPPLRKAKIEFLQPTCAV